MPALSVTKICEVRWRVRYGCECTQRLSVRFVVESSGPVASKESSAACLSSPTSADSSDAQVSPTTRVGWMEAMGGFLCPNRLCACWFEEETGIIVATVDFIAGCTDIDGKVLHHTIWRSRDDLIWVRKNIHGNFVGRKSVEYYLFYCMLIVNNFSIGKWIRIKFLRWQNRI